MVKVRCEKCGSTDVDVEDLGLTCTEHYCECNECHNVDQSYFSEVD